MQKITNQSHNRDTFLIAASRMVERAGYYGLRALLVLHLISEPIQMDRSGALEIYSLFTSILLFGAIGGAVLGDLIIGNKKTLISGAIIQSIGAFMLCIPSMAGVYLGLGFVVIGGAMYSPNLISTFGKLYLNKTKLLDAGFTIFYLAINLGAFLGIALLGLLGETYGWHYGFMTAGVLMLLSIAPFLFTSKEVERTSIEPHTESNPMSLFPEEPMFANIDDQKLRDQETSIDHKQNEFSISSMPLPNRAIHIIAVSILVALFWTIFEFTSMSTFQIQSELSNIQGLNIPPHKWTYYSSILTLVVAFIAAISWTYRYSRSYFKILIAFICGAISIGLLFTIPENPTSEHAIIYILSLLFMGIAEIHIGPILHSVLTRYANPKYLAIIISLSVIPSRLFSYILGIFGIFGNGLYENNFFTFWIPLIICIMLSIGIAIYLLMTKSEKTV